MGKIKETMLRIFLLLLGLVIAHFGVTLFLMANLGADPFNVLVQGVYRFLSSGCGSVFFTHGRTHIAISFVIILVLLLVNKTYIKIGTVLCMICGGPIIDFFTWLLNPLFASGQPLAVRVLVNVIGCIILAAGMTVVIKSEAGTGPNDLVALVISEMRNWKFGVVRIVVDFVFVAIGFFLGGAVGIGTIICAFVVGPVAGLLMPYSEKFVRGILRKGK